MMCLCLERVHGLALTKLPPLIPPPPPPPLLSAEPQSLSLGPELKGVAAGLAGVSERAVAEGHVGKLTRPRAFSQSAMHSLERSERGNTQALAELAQVWNTFPPPKTKRILHTGV